MFIVHKLRSNTLPPAWRFWKVTEYLTEAQPRSNILHLPKPEGWWQKYLIEIHEKFSILLFSFNVKSLNYLFHIFFHCKNLAVTCGNMWLLLAVTYFHIWPLKKDNTQISYNIIEGAYFDIANVLRANMEIFGRKLEVNISIFGYKLENTVHL